MPFINNVTMGNSILHKENSTHGMFYIKKDKGIASELNYKLHDNVMTIDHTETKPEFEGRGLGSKLVEEAVTYARKKNFKVNPLCPFVEVKFVHNGICC
jgi:predicted GNAT family acetyltransferase